MYYGVFRIPMRLNGWLYRCFRQPASNIKVHLGCGQKNYLSGWVNVDANIITARIDLWANLSDPLPFRSESVAAFYSFHVIEHLPDSFLPKHFGAMFRALAPGGRIRIGGPHGGNACQKYIEGDREWFGSYPDDRLSVGGRMANFILCRGEHLTILTEDYLRELAEAAGFSEISFWSPMHSENFGVEVLAVEHESDPLFPHSVIMEAIRPASGFSRDRS